MKKIYILLSFFCLQLLFSQTTNYEKKVSEIKNTFFTKMGLKKENSKIWENWNFSNQSDFLSFLTNSQNNKYFNQSFLSNLKSYNGQNLTNNFLKEISEAKKLKNKDDLKNENYEKTDHYEFRNMIYNEYLRWAEKGEFEKTEDYNIRLNEINADNFFKNKSYEIIVSMTDCFNSSCMDKFILGNYNADKEYYDITFKKYNKFKIIGKLSVPIDQAENVKKDRDYNSNFELFDLVFWDNYFVPKRVYINFKNLNQKYLATFEFQNEKEVIFTNEDISSDLQFPMYFNLNDECVKKLIDGSIE